MTSCLEQSTHHRKVLKAAQEDTWILDLGLLPAQWLPFLEATLLVTGMTGKDRALGMEALRDKEKAMPH